MSESFASATTVALIAIAILTLVIVRRRNKRVDVPARVKVVASLIAWAMVAVAALAVWMIARAQVAR